MCTGDLSVEKVQNALIKILGVDSKPNPKDLVRLGRNVIKEEVNYVDEDEYYYTNSWDEYDGYGDAYCANYGYWEYGNDDCYSEERAQ